MPRYATRRASREDVPVLVSHRRRMFESMGMEDARALDASDRAYGAWLAERVERGLAAAFVVEEDGRAAASGVVWLQEVQPRPGALGTRRPYLMAMWTEPAARGRGHGTRVVEAAMAWCAEEGHGRLELHATDSARGLYERLGFLPTPEMRIEIG